MLYREIIAVCSEIHTKHINTLCGQNVELLNVKLAVHILTTDHRLLSWQYCRVSLGALHRAYQWTALCSTHPAPFCLPTP